MSGVSRAKKESIRLWWHTPKEMDLVCCTYYCGMQAQIVIHGGERVLPLCNTHASHIASEWENIQMIEESEPPKFVDPATGKKRRIEGGMGWSEEERLR